MKINSKNIFFTYIIFSPKIGKYYIGSTSDLDKRLLEHNSGKTYSTRNKGPWELVYSKQFENKHDALVMEKLIKSYKGGNAFKKLIGSI